MKEKSYNKITRRNFLSATVTAGAVFSSGAVTTNSLLAQNGSSERSKPNIVFVFADQMRSHVLGCYGNKQVGTPNFDKLAKEGVLFTNGLSTWPICSPFRAMLLTGMYPMNNGTVKNDAAVRRDLPTIATVCKENGYATGYIGKWHLEWDLNPLIPKDRRLGFDYFASRNCSHKYFDSFYCADDGTQMPLPGYEPQSQTNLAIQYINQNKAKPFCLFLSWGPPHDPYIAADSYMEHFLPEKIQLRENVNENKVVEDLLANDKTEMDEKLVEKRNRWRDTLNDDKAVRSRLLRGYYAATKVLDDCMGELIEAIDKAGLKENTIIVFTSDHGDMLGSHRMVSKQLPFEESISIPFFVRYPRRIPAGTVTDALLAPIDIMPTLLDLARLECPDVDGINLIDAALGKKHDQQDAVLIMKLVPGGNPWLANGITPWRGVRTKKYTYARLLDRGPWVLFDNEKDPYQLKNLINDPDYKKIRDQLEERMQQLLKKANDPCDTGKILAYNQKRLAEYKRSK